MELRRKRALANDVLGRWGGYSLLTGDRVGVINEHLCGSRWCEFYANQTQSWRRMAMRLASMAVIGAGPSIRQVLPVVVVEEHHEVLPYWIDSGVDKSLLLHIDAHSDLAPPPMSEDRAVRGKLPWYKIRGSMARATANTSATSTVHIEHNDQFILQACRLGLLTHVVWVYPSWDESGYYTQSKHSAYSQPWAYTFREGHHKDVHSSAADRQKPNSAGAQQLYSCHCASQIEGLDWAAADWTSSLERAVAQATIGDSDCIALDDNGYAVVVPPGTSPGSCDTSHQKGCGAVMVGEGWLLTDAGDRFADSLRSYGGDTMLDIDEDYFGTVSTQARLLQLQWRPGELEELTRIVYEGCPTREDEAAADTAFRSVFEWLIECKQITGRQSTSNHSVRRPSVAAASACGQKPIDSVRALRRFCLDMTRLARWATRASPANARTVSNLGLCLTYRPGYDATRHRFRVCDEGVGWRQVLKAFGDGDNHDVNNHSALTLLNQDAGEIKSRIQRFRRILRKTWAPFRVSSVARSVRDGHTPRKTWSLVEEGVLLAVREAAAANGDADVRVWYDRDLLGGKDGRPL